MSSRLLLPLALTALLAASACTSGTRQALGAESSAPDEFRVVTIAPLTVPPEYNLRPPRPGALRPEDVFPDQQARAAMLGQIQNSSATDAETLFAARAGASEADPSIRAVIDGETAAIVRKPENFADRLLFWRSGTYVPPAGRPAEIDPEQERERIEAVTGGGDVEIERRARTGPKLPGL